MPISKRTIIEFRETISNWVLRQIDDAFDAEDIKLSVDFEPGLSGQRRTRAAQYLHSVDVKNPDEHAKLLRVIEHVLINFAEQNEDATKLLGALRRDGYEFRNEKLVEVSETTHREEAQPTSPQTLKASPLNKVESRSPTAFVSYSWDNEPHKQWVVEFAERLRRQSVDAKLDRWDIELGQHIPHFMETAVSTNDFVLIVLTPNYRKKSDERAGGVGYEGHIMTAEAYSGVDPRKFIPVLREGTWETASPRWLKGKRGVDLRAGQPDYEEQFHDLTATLHGLQKKAPPLGPPLKGSAAAETTRPQPIQQNQFEPIRILNVVASELGTPRNDGTPGSALYAVPFQLSREPTAEWAKHFMDTWDMPPSFSTMHRPGIARISRDRLILDGTTVEEVAKVHRETLKFVLDKVNRDVAAYEERKRQCEARDAEELRRHKEAAEEAARKISFD